MGPFGLPSDAHETKAIAQAAAMGAVFFIWQYVWRVSGGLRRDGGLSDGEHLPKERPDTEGVSRVERDSHFEAFVRPDFERKEFFLFRDFDEFVDFVALKGRFPQKYPGFLLDFPERDR